MTACKQGPRKLKLRLGVQGTPRLITKIMNWERAVRKLNGTLDIFDQTASDPLSPKYLNSDFGPPPVFGLNVTPLPRQRNWSGVSMIQLSGNHT